MDSVEQDTDDGAEIEKVEENKPCVEEYVITAYCPCISCCGKTDGITATGTKATEGRTIAVDPTKIPYGTEVLIDGCVYVAEDCGGLIKGNKIDLFFNNHQSALEWGRQTKQVTILN